MAEAEERRRLNRLVQREIKASERAVDIFVADVIQFLERNLLEIGGSLDEVDIASLSGLVDSFFEAGLGDKIDSITELFEEQVQFIVEKFEEQGVPVNFSQPSVDTIDAFIRFNVEKIDVRMRSTLINVRQFLLDQRILGRPKVPKADMDEFLDGLNGTQRRNLTTELNTSVAAFDRTVSRIQSEEVGIDLFIYSGPFDGVTRPFCRETLTRRTPPIYTATEIDGTLNNEVPGLDTFTFGGGYNCRHQWLGVTETFARSLGWKG